MSNDDDSALAEFLRLNPMSLDAQKLRGEAQRKADEANPGAADARLAKSLAEQYASLDPSTKALVEGGTSERSTIGGHSDAESGKRDETGSTFIRAGQFSSDQVRLARLIDETNQRYVAAVAEGNPVAAKKAKLQLDSLANSMQWQQWADEANAVHGAMEQGASLDQMVGDAEALEEAQQRLTVNARRAKYGLPPIK